MFTSQVRQVFEADNLPLSFPDWTLTGTGPNGETIEMSGQTSDVLRKQPDGTWRFVIDDPYGSAHGF
jgi:ketosteroid isomerase-like protein